MLPHVVDAVGRGRVPIFVDGGIRRGTDVLKVGADAHIPSTFRVAGMQCEASVSCRLFQQRQHTKRTTNTLVRPQDPKEQP